MQFGYTIPLQRRLKIPELPYSTSIDLRFCWDLHILTVDRHKMVLVTNCNNRYSVLLYMKGRNWKQLSELALKEINAAFAQEGLTEFDIARYFSLAGPVELTRTHGRKPVAGLNQAADKLFFSLEHVPLNECNLSQPQLNMEMNTEICHATGYADYGTPRGFLLTDFQSL